MSETKKPSLITRWAAQQILEAGMTGEKWESSTNVDGEIVLERGAVRLLVRLEPNRLCAILNAAEDEKFANPGITWRELYESLDETMASATTLFGQTMAQAMVHVAGTHFIVECALCGRRSYQDGSRIDGKALHTEDCILTGITLWLKK